MKKTKCICEILFWLTLASPFLGVYLAAKIGDYPVFGTAGILKTLWISFFLIPIAVLSIVIAKKLKKNGATYKKNYIAACICIPLLVIDGLFGILFGLLYSGNTEVVEKYEKRANVNLPEHIKVLTVHSGYNLSIIKITDKEEQKAFEREILDGKVWESYINLSFLSFASVDYQSIHREYECFIFNGIREDLVVWPYWTKGCIFMAYDFEKGRILVIERLKVE